MLNFKELAENILTDLMNNGSMSDILLKTKGLYFVGLIAGLFLNWKIALSTMVWITIIATVEYMIRRREYMKALKEEAKKEEKIEEQ